MADPARRQQEETPGFVVRTYRDYTQRNDLVAFCIRWKETDLYIRASRDLSREALDAVLQSRAIIENYIVQRPVFQTSMVPLSPDDNAPALVAAMLEAARITGVGPMAGVAGAVAEHVGRSLMSCSNEVIVENGGDLFLETRRPLTVGIFAGTSALSDRVGLAIPPGSTPCGICTSSGTVGPSVSFGKADAVTVRAASTILADAAATAIANRIRKPADIEPALEHAGAIAGVQGAVAILGDHIGIWGDMDIVSLQNKPKQGNSR